MSWNTVRYKGVTFEGRDLTVAEAGREYERIYGKRSQKQIREEGAVRRAASGDPRTHFVVSWTRPLGSDRAGPGRIEFVDADTARDAHRQGLITGLRGGGREERAVIRARRLYTIDGPRNRATPHRRAARARTRR